VQGIEGYRGITKRMMQHPKVLSVVAEVVYSNDVFDWAPGEMARPSHRVDWFGNRGELQGAYAYAILQGDATSKVVVVGPTEIAKAKETSDGANSSYSPWKKHPDAMYRKTALRRLEPYVPKATEVSAQERERSETAVEVAGKRELPELPPVGTDEAPKVDQTTGEVLDAELVDDVELPEDNFGGSDGD
jgi:recombination protein RecT